MKKVFLFTNKAGQTTALGIALSDPTDYKKIILRYYNVTDDFCLTEITNHCKETRKIESLCRKWCDQNKIVLWSC